MVKLLKSLLFPLLAMVAISGGAQVAANPVNQCIGGIVVLNICTVGSFISNVGQVWLTNSPVLSNNHVSVSILNHSPIDVANCNAINAGNIQAFVIQLAGQVAKVDNCKA